MSNFKNHTETAIAYRLRDFFYWEMLRWIKVQEYDKNIFSKYIFYSLFCFERTKLWKLEYERSDGCPETEASYSKGREVGLVMRKNLPIFLALCRFEPTISVRSPGVTYAVSTPEFFTRKKLFSFDVKLVLSFFASSGTTTPSITTFFVINFEILLLRICWYSQFGGFCFITFLYILWYVLHSSELCTLPLILFRLSVKLLLKMKGFRSWIQMIFFLHFF